MKTTYRWIRDYVPDYDGPVEEMCRLLTMSGTEVEGTEPFGEDTIIEAAVTSNRVDCLGVLGLAREVAAVSGRALREPPADVAFAHPATSAAASVAVEDWQACPRYTGHVVTGVTVGPSPSWLASRLEAVGVRPVNNIVDVTNFVLLELNQPLHAFDLGRIGEKRIVVRWARKGETLTAINQKAYALDPEMLVIADAARPVALAGVMGGVDTEVSTSTKDVFLEGACFEPLRVRRTARALALHSDASFRFERGVDFDRVLVASRRAARLIVEVGGGRVLETPIDLFDPSARRHPALIVLRDGAVEKLTGVAAPRRRIAGILLSLGCEVFEDRNALRVTPPSFRPDLQREVDLVEEVVRIEGLDRVQGETRMTVRAVPERKDHAVRERLRDRLAGAGLYETVTTSFVAPGLPASVCLLGDSEPVVVRNAVRADENTMRRSLLPSLLGVKKANQDHGTAAVRLFEMTTAYLDRRQGGIPEHLPILGILADGDLRDVRGILEDALGALGIAATFEPADAPHLEPGLALRIVANKGSLGAVGTVSGDLVRHFDLKHTPFYAEVRLAPVVEAASLIRRFAGLPRFPSVERDLAVVVDEATAWGDIESVIGSVRTPRLAEIRFFDVYTGKQVPPGKKSLAFSMVFRRQDATLTKAEVDADVKTIVDALASKLGAAVRS